MEDIIQNGIKKIVSTLEKHKVEIVKSKLLELGYPDGFYESQLGKKFSKIAIDIRPHWGTENVNDEVWIVDDGTPAGKVIVSFWVEPCLRDNNQYSTTLKWK